MPSTAGTTRRYYSVNTSGDTSTITSIDIPAGNIFINQFQPETQRTLIDESIEIDHTRNCYRVTRRYREANGSIITDTHLLPLDEYELINGRLHERNNFWYELNRGDFGSNTLSVENIRMARDEYQRLQYERHECNPKENIIHPKCMHPDCVRARLN